MNSPRALCLSMILSMLIAVAAKADPPPNLINYQGLLLNSSGQPILVTKTVFFSIYEGGTQNSGGTLKYRESAFITPDTKGIFQHQIGSGAVVSGTLTPALFNTPQPLYIEVAVDTAANPLLPRARITTVGYAFVAHTALNAPSGGLPGAPSVTAVADHTGGLLVVGDLLRIDGSGLLNSTVLVGGATAPIKSRTDAQIICQIPAGTKMGLNSVTLADSTGTNASASVAHVDVRRLIVTVRSSGGSGRVSIHDAATRNQVVELTVGTVNRTDGSGNPLSLQAGIGHQGALLLVASGSGSIYAIDLTANPPSFVDTANIGSQVRGVDISPDGRVAIVADFAASGGSQVRAVAINELAPPYGGSVLGSANGLESSEIPSGFGATGVQFIGDGQFVVLGRSANQLISYYRQPGSTGGAVRDIERIPSSDMPLGSTDIVPVGPDPVRVQLTPDQTRLIITSRASTNISAIYAATFWPAGATPGTGAAGGQRPLKVAIAPDNHTLFAASFGTGSASDNSSDADRLKVFSLVSDSVAFRGQIPGPRHNSNQEAFAMVAIEPVEGNLMAASTNRDKLFITRRAGNSLVIDNNDTNTNTTYLSLLSPITLGGSNMDTVELLFQP